MRVNKQNKKEPKVPSPKPNVYNSCFPEILKPYKVVKTLTCNFHDFCQKCLCIMSLVHMRVVSFVFIDVKICRYNNIKSG